ncbi:MAG: hypothetical protein V3T78_08260 [Dehalococcoidia bacterium]
MRLHDILYGRDTHRVFDNWWEYARREYLPLLEGRGGDTLTQYYDPLINYHHLTGHGGGLGAAFAVAPQKREAGRLLFETAAEALGWTSLDPFRESSRELTTLEPSPRNTLTGLTLAREYGNDAVYAKLKAHAEAHYEPTWNQETGEFSWGFGLNEPHPRGQLNAAMMTSEAGSEGALSRLFNQPNLRKFTDPTVHGVDFPIVCLSQAWYDVEPRRLVVSTDSGIPGAVGQATSFRVSDVDAQRCSVVTDGQLSRNWRVVDDELEINTTVGEHTFLITNQ